MNPRAAQLLRRFCSDCHSETAPSAELNLTQLASQPDFARRFRDWRNVVQALQQGRMPPVDAEQPEASQRRELWSMIQKQLLHVAAEHATDPGPVTLRRLTSAEYAYTVNDLTGLDLSLGSDFVSDAVGGEGFTNVGDVQFVQDSTLERYLAAARKIADHAVIGAGPIYFYQDPGESGFELSAIKRIQQIYRTHGFRTAAGEGGEPFGLDRYSRAMFVAWQFRHRDVLQLSDETLESLAAKEQLDARFANYIWSLLTDGPHSFPTSEIVTAWRTLPTPEEGAHAVKLQQQSRAECDRINRLLQQWQNRLGKNPDAKEEARILSEDSFDVSRTQAFDMNINWPDGTSTAHLTFSIAPADGKDQLSPTVLWQEPTVQFRIPDRQLEEPVPLKTLISASDALRLNFGGRPGDGEPGPQDFITVGAVEITIEIPIPPGASSARFQVRAELDTRRGESGIVRCTIAQQEETDQGKSVSGLLADPKAPGFADWKAGVLDFARRLPQISHREPAPSDRDPIPAPFDPSYNNPQRNLFHSRIKYHRDDQFLVSNVLDDDARLRLDHAWSDLLSSFEYHNAYLRFVAEKYALNLGEPAVAQLDPAWISSLPQEPQGYVRKLQVGDSQIERALVVAEPGHLLDVMEFAGRAWRRPLEPAEKDRLRGYYESLRRDDGLDHRQATRVLLTRVLVSPNFLYRVKRPTAAESETEHHSANEAVPLSDWELASRLSYFLWSSAPDEELRRAASAGRLHTEQQLAHQARRMLRDPKARRLAREFFGQWLGFYQFDRYRGVDAQRFPEFTAELKSAMYEQAVTFFDYIQRQDRPVGDILFADYVFVNPQLAQHYGMTPPLTTDGFTRVELTAEQHRGGMLGLAAVLTVTSAPRRTSPVKRGDWILRRVLGTPVPPPPADAGSIPADDVLTDGLTLRQRLEAHRQDTSCMNCHSRIDPLGFALENFDAIGRWRSEYRDGQPIDTTGVLRDGSEISGPAGLRDYLARHELLFHRTLCTKLVGYALGRSESISDVALIQQMMDGLKDDGRFFPLVEKIVTSRQFRFQRGRVEESRRAIQAEKHD